MLHAFKHLMYDLPRRAVENWLEDDASLLAAAVAYYFAISLFPLLMVLVSVVGFIFERTQFGQDAEHEIIAAVASQVSPEVAQQLEKLVGAVRDQAPTGGPLGALLLLAAVIAMFVQFDYSFDRIWKVESRRAGGVLVAIKRILFVRLKAFLMLAGVGVLVMITFIAGLVWNGIDTYATGLTPFWSQISWWLRPLLNLTINVSAIAMIYRVLPKVEVKWRDALAGAVVAGIGWEIGRQLLAAFVIGREYGSAYGVIGSFLAVMLWCYYVVAVLFFGAEYARAAGEYRCQVTGVGCREKSF